jgi:hypothetical protein
MYENESLFPPFPFNEEVDQWQQHNSQPFGQEFQKFDRETPPRPPYQGGTGYGGGTPPRPPYQGGTGYGGGTPPRPPQPHHDGPPASPPPSYIPHMTQTGYQAVNPGAMRRCLHRYTYVWLRNGRSFWFYPTYAGRNTVAGYRWRQNAQRWVYFEIDTDLIRSFQCY